MNIDIICNPFGKSGYDYHAKALIKALKPHVNLSIVNNSQPEASEQNEEFMYFASMLKSNNLKPDVLLQFQAPTAWRYVMGCKNVGIFPWETNAIPRRDMLVPNAGCSPEHFNWVKQCNSMDEVWTFSGLSVTALKNSGVIKPIRLINGPFDFKLATSAYEPVPIINLTHTSSGVEIEPIDKKFVVSFIGEWSLRKDITSLIKCAALCLPASKTLIVLKTGSNDKKSDTIINKINEVKNGLKLPVIPQIILIDEQVSDATINTIIDNTDVYLSTSKGEGFDLPLLHAMSKGKVCIAGFNGVHMDYLTKDNSLPINCTPEVVYYPEDPFYPDYIYYSSDQIWSKPNEIELINNIQKVYQDWEKDKGLSKYNSIKENAKNTVKNKYSISKCGEECFQLLKNITRVL